MKNNEIQACAFPWFEMDIYSNKQVWCCCYYNDLVDSWDLKSDFDFDRYWNGSRMQYVRHINKTGNFENTGCNNCMYFNLYNSSETFLKIPGDVNKLQRENWENALRNYNERKIVVDSLPVKYCILFGYYCNLDCIMCSQGEDKNNKDQISYESLIKIKDKLKTAYDIQITGGEIFALQNARNFIKNISLDSDFDDVRLDLLSNGALLHKNFDYLKEKRKIALRVSLDAIGKPYEYIRRNSSWEQVEKNMLTFKEIGLKNNLQWSINTANLVMKSSLPYLNKLIDWSIKNDIICSFYPIVRRKYTVSEDIYRYPSLLNEIPNWQDILDSAVSKLNANKWHDSASGLMKIKEELENNLTGTKESCINVFAEFLKKENHPELIERAESLIFEKRYTEASDILNRVLKYDPENSNAICDLAAIDLSEGRFDIALEKLNSVLSINPKHSKALQVLTVLKNFNSKLIKNNGNSTDILTMNQEKSSISSNEDAYLVNDKINNSSSFNPEVTVSYNSESFISYAYWKHRETLQKDYNKLKLLSDAVNWSNDLSLSQYAQLLSFSMEFKPDIILELGRGYGNSTCVFTEAANLLNNNCTVISICFTDWGPTIYKLKEFLPSSWFEPLQIMQKDITTVDYYSLFKNYNKILIFWDAHGFNIAECVLGQILPVIANRDHAVIMHDISDARYASQSSSLYNKKKLWIGNNDENRRIRIDNIDSAVEQSISILDFCTRNGLTLFSADHGLHQFIGKNQEAKNEMINILGNELFSLSAHWRWFTLNEKPGRYTFPYYSELIRNYIFRVEAYIKNKEFNEAIDLLELIFRIDENDVDGLNNLAVIAILLNNLEKAKEILTYILNQSPQNEIAMENLEVLNNLKT